MKKTAVLYTRVSTNFQVKYGYNLDEQERRGRAYFESLFNLDEYELRVAREEGKSGKTLDRPELQKLIKKIERKAVSVVIIYSIDRISRTVLDFLGLLDIFEKYGVRLISMSDNFDTSTPNGKFTLVVLSALAQLEREQIAERVYRGMGESARQGNYAKAKIPYGYVKVNNKLVIDPEAAAIIRHIFNEIAYTEKSPHQVMDELNMANAGNRNWASNSVYQIIRNEIYIGTYRDKTQVIENHTPAIVDKQLFDIVQTQIRIKTISQYKYVFREMTYCKTCGEMMEHTCTTKKRNGKKSVYLYYRCPKCQNYISEDKLMKSLNPRINTMIGEKVYDEKVVQFKTKIQNCKGRIAHHRIMYMKHKTSKLISLEKIGYETNKILNFEKLIEETQKEKKSFNFRHLAYPDQRKLLYKYIERIEVQENRVTVNYKES